MEPVKLKASAQYLSVGLLSFLIIVFDLSNQSVTDAQNVGRVADREW